MPMTRRTFLAGAGAATATLGTLPDAANSADRKDNKNPICIFSKHLQWLDYREIAEIVAEIGFDGIDLTVRPKGHVLPERVQEDLPRALEAAQTAGLSIPMMTTAIQEPDDP
ncbi:MAG: twin-arginine translocation signal domain-containing protein, partial [Chlorobiales bacterium]|nr:twin-arginine translocation signal domain-containing protein [Chlorobiales bacterium]